MPIDTPRDKNTKVQIDNTRSKNNRYTKKNKNTHMPINTPRDKNTHTHLCLTQHIRQEAKTLI